MSFDAVLSKILEHGTPGITVVLLLLVLRQLYMELKAEREGRQADAKEYANKLLQITDRVHSTVDQQAEMMDRLIDAQKDK